ncbi:MAG: S8 family peptidase [Rhodothermales bacterium]
MKPKKFLVILFGMVAFVLAVEGSSTAYGQSKKEAGDTKYWILFADKDAGLGKGPAAIEPGFVSERALARRKLRGRQMPKSFDAPVSPAYVETLESMGIEPIVQSRWINGVSAWLSPEELASVEKLSFVRELRAVAVSVEQSIPEPVVVSTSSSPMELNFGLSSAQMTAINAVDPIEQGIIGTGILLGFLDTTTDTLHPALKHLADDGRIVAVRDFTTEAGLALQTNKHALNTASVALGFDEGNIIGACYGGEYMLGTTEYAPSETNQEEDFFVAGMEWMERMGADIVNVSLGYSTFDTGQHSYTYEDMDGNTAITTRAADRAAGLGVVVVVSAGNESCASPDNCWYYITSPADGDSVITAGASFLDGTPVSFSGAGPTYDGRIKPDVAAPGYDVKFATSSGGYGSGGGTSFSSPFVASVACQILQANPNLNPIDVRTILRATASQASNPDNKLGWGVINSQAAVSLSKVAITGTETEGLPEGSPSIAVYPNPAADESVVSVDSPPERGDIRIALYDVLGREVVEARPARAGQAVTATLTVRNLPAGTYFVSISGDGIAESRPLIVTH